jgi:hypothetical protein
MAVLPSQLLLPVLSACPQGLLQSDVARRQLRNATSVRLLLDRAPVLLDMSPKLRDLLETSNWTDDNQVPPLFHGLMTLGPCQRRQYNQSDYLMVIFYLICCVVLRCGQVEAASTEAITSFLQTAAKHLTTKSQVHSVRSRVHR